MSMCATCQIEARPGSGVCHRCGRPLAETLEAAAAIKPVASPRPAAMNIGASRPDATTLAGATTLPSIPALQGIQPAQHRAEPGPDADPTADQRAPRREPSPPARPSRRRRVGLILVALVLALVLAWVASQVVPGLTHQEPVAPPAAVKPAAPGDSQAVNPGVGPATSGSSAAPAGSASSAGPAAGLRQPDAAELLGQAGRAAAAADWTTAIGLYEQARGQAPANEDTQDRLASAYQSRAQGRLASDFDGAAADFTVAEELGEPGAPSGRQQVELARRYAVAEAAWGHDDDTVLTELVAVYTLDPSYREVVDKLYAALLGLAGRQVGAGDRDGAVVTLGRAAALAPERAEAQAQLAAMQASTQATGSDTGGQTSQRSGGSGGWRSWVDGFQWP